jgi:hypothetical protein
LSTRDPHLFLVSSFAVGELGTLIKLPGVLLLLSVLWSGVQKTRFGLSQLQLLDMAVWALVTASKLCVVVQTVFLTCQ